MFFTGKKKSENAVKTETISKVIKKEKNSKEEENIFQVNVLIARIS